MRFPCFHENPVFSIESGLRKRRGIRVAESQGPKSVRGRERKRDLDLTTGRAVENGAPAAIARSKEPESSASGPANCSDEAPLPFSPTLPASLPHYHIARRKLVVLLFFFTSSPPLLRAQTAPAVAVTYIPGVNIRRRRYRKFCNNVSYAAVNPRPAPK